jgi:hypothetical protein
MLCSLGCCNLILVQAYFDLSPIARHLALTVKTWAKRRGLVSLCKNVPLLIKNHMVQNDPAAANGPTTLSSYSLLLLLLAYLQYTGHLPNLQDKKLIAASGVEPSHLWLRPVIPRPRRVKQKKAKSEQGRNNVLNQPSQPTPSQPNDSQNLQTQKNKLPSTLVDSSTQTTQKTPSPAPSRTQCDTTYAPALPSDYPWSQVPHQLDSALKGFYAFYATEFDPEMSMVSIERGGIIPRDVPFVEPPPVKKKKQEPKQPRRKKNKAAEAAENGTENQSTHPEDVPDIDSKARDAKEVHATFPSHSESRTLGKNATLAEKLAAATLSEDGGAPQSRQDQKDPSNKALIPPEDAAASGTDNEPGDDNDTGDDADNTADSGDTDKWKEHLLITQDPFVRNSCRSTPATSGI